VIEIGAAEFELDALDLVGFQWPLGVDIEQGGGPAGRSEQPCRLGALGRRVRESSRLTEALR